MVCNFYCKQTTAERTADDRFGHCRAVLLSRFNYKISSAGEVVFNADAIPEKSAQKIFRAADQIIRAGRSETFANVA